MNAPRRVVAPVVLALAVSLGGVGASTDPIASLPARTLAIEDGIVSFQAALVVDMSNPNLLSKLPTKYMLYVTNETSSPVWVKMDWRVPGQKPFSSFGKVDASQRVSGWVNAGKEVAWDQEIVVDVAFFADKKRQRALGSREVAFSFDSKDAAQFLAQAKEVNRVSVKTAYAYGKPVDQPILAGFREMDSHEVLGTASPKGGTDLAVAPVPPAGSAKPAAESEDDLSEQLRIAGTLDLVIEEGLKEQITLSIPGGWSAHDQTKLLTGMPGPLGTVLYSPAKLVSNGEETGDSLSESLMRLSSGEIPSLQLDRIPAPKGTTCAGITPAAQRRILRMVEDQEPMFARGHTVVEAARAEPAALTGVHGLRIRARSRNPEGVEQALDLIALSDGTTLYLLYARASADHFERSRGILDRVLPTVQLTRCGARR